MGYLINFLIKRCWIKKAVAPINSSNFLDDIISGMGSDNSYNNNDKLNHQNNYGGKSR